MTSKVLQAFSMELFPQSLKQMIRLEASRTLHRSAGYLLFTLMLNSVRCEVVPIIMEFNLPLERA
jgi:hypothetical protein